MSSSATAGAGSGLDRPLGISPLPSCPLSRDPSRTMSRATISVRYFFSPFCSVLPLIVPVFESFVRGEADFSDRNSTGRVLDLRILAYVSHQRKWWNWQTKDLAERTPAQI